MPSPTTMPTASAITQIDGWPSGRPNCCGRICAWVTPMIMPMKPSSEPTDRSMLRVTITSTMPVAMMETEADWTDRFHRLRGVRKARLSKSSGLTPRRRLLMMWKPAQMTISAPTMPSMRVSSSVAFRKRATGPPSDARAWSAGAWVTVSVMRSSRPPTLGRPLAAS